MFADLYAVRWGQHDKSNGRYLGKILNIAILFNIQKAAL